MNKTLIALIILTTPFSFLGWIFWIGMGDRNGFTMIWSGTAVAMAYTSAFAWASGATALDNLGYTVGVGFLVLAVAAKQALRDWLVTHARRAQHDGERSKP